MRILPKLNQLNYTYEVISACRLIVVDEAGIENAADFHRGSRLWITTDPLLSFEHTGRTYFYDSLGQLVYVGASLSSLTDIYMKLAPKWVPPVWQTGPENPGPIAVSYGDALARMEI